MTVRKIHSSSHLLVEVDRLRALHRQYLPSKARDRLKRDVHNLVQLGIAQGIIQPEERGLYMGPPLED